MKHNCVRVHRPANGSYCNCLDMSSFHLVFHIWLSEVMSRSIHTCLFMSAHVSLIHVSTERQSWCIGTISVFLLYGTPELVHLHYIRFSDFVHTHTHLKSVRGKRAGGKQKSIATPTRACPWEKGMAGEHMPPLAHRKNRGVWLGTSSAIA